MKSKYKAIVFDIGNVIFDISFDLVFDYCEKLTGKKAADIKASFTFNEVFERFERGHITASDFVAEFNNQTKLNLTFAEFDACWNAIYIDAFPGIDDLLIRLKKNHRVLAFSNTNILHTNDWLIRYEDTISHFEKIFLSNEMGARKPDAEAFQMVLDYLQIKPEDVLFLDDKLENILGAQAMGIHTIHVKTYQQMKEDLKTLGLTN